MVILDPCLEHYTEMEGLSCIVEVSGLDDGLSLMQTVTSKEEGMDDFSLPLMCAEEAFHLISWFAKAWPVYGFEARSHGEEGDIGAIVNKLWPDLCHDQCSFTAIRPQPKHSNALRTSFHVLVFRKTLYMKYTPVFASINVFLPVSQSQQDRTESSFYRACLVPNLKRSTIQHLVGDLPGSMHMSETCKKDLLSRPAWGCHLELRMEQQQEVDDDHSWMQVAATHGDVVMRYLRQTVPRPFHVVVWFHPADEIGQVCRTYVQLPLQLFSPATTQIRQVWAHVYGRRSSFIFPVRPAPMTAIGRQPHVIVTTAGSVRSFSLRTKRASSVK